MKYLAITKDMSKGYAIELVNEYLGKKPKKRNTRDKQNQIEDMIYNYLDNSKQITKKELYQLIINKDDSLKKFLYQSGLDYDDIIMSRSNFYRMINKMTDNNMIVIEDNILIPV